MRATESATEGLFSSKQKEGHLVADVRLYAIMRERMDADYQEFQEIIKHMNMMKAEIKKWSPGENSGETP